ncbi:unnamed protein product [Peniophora sp. CBMAI 1063]|nr:unnamed protein product [Peniophora sp. CBMAI 1063]
MSFAAVCRSLLSGLAYLVQSACRNVTSIFAGSTLAIAISRIYRATLRSRFSAVTLVLVGGIIWIACSNKAVSVSLHGRSPISILVVSPFSISTFPMPTILQLEEMRAQIVSLNATLARLQQAQSNRDLDSVGKADFALYSAGAKIISSYTSQTLRSALPQSDLWPTGPTMALHHETHAGYCWPFSGQQGRIGIELTHRILLESVTIEHLPGALSLDRTSAPKHMSVWGLVEGTDNLHRAITWQERGRVLGRRKHFALELGDHPPDVQRLLKASRWAPIASFVYDINAPSAVQSFTVDDDVPALDVDFKTVLLLIHDNWGNEDTTCLYRVRVHGRPAAMRD